MGYDGYWNFYQVSDKMFPAINFEFASAQKGIKTIFDERSCFELPEETAKNGVFTLYDNKGKVFFHTPFANLDYQVSHAANWQLPYLKQSLQSRTLPTSVLFYGIGRERFFQLPGRLGNMLIHSSDIELTMFKVSQILNIDREMYFQEARGHLDYSTGWDGGDEERGDVIDILDTLPNALAQAQSNGVGLISLVTWEFWTPRY